MAGLARGVIRGPPGEVIRRLRDGGSMLRWTWPANESPVL